MSEQNVVLTEEEQRMLDGMRLGLDPFPTHRNFAVLLSLVKKGAFGHSQRREQALHEIATCAAETLCNAGVQSWGDGGEIGDALLSIKDIVETVWNEEKEAQQNKEGHE